MDSTVSLSRKAAGANSIEIFTHLHGLDKVPPQGAAMQIAPKALSQLLAMPLALATTLAFR